LFRRIAASLSRRCSESRLVGRPIPAAATKTLGRLLCHMNVVVGLPLLGSARVSRVGFRIARKQAFSIAHPTESSRRSDTVASTRDACATRPFFRGQICYRKLQYIPPGYRFSPGGSFFCRLSASFQSPFMLARQIIK